MAGGGAGGDWPTLRVYWVRTPPPSNKPTRNFQQQQHAWSPARKKHQEQETVVDDRGGDLECEEAKWGVEGGRDLSRRVAHHAHVAGACIYINIYVCVCMC